MEKDIMLHKNTQIVNEKLHIMFPSRYPIERKE